MTIEEAINVLQNTAWLGTEKDREEVKKALETLSNTSEIPNSSDDLINRQAVIDAQGEKMNRQRKVVITTTYNDLGIIVDTKAEELDLSVQPNLQPTCNNLATDTISRQTAINYVDDIPYIKEHPNLGLIWKEWIEALPSAQPEQHWIPCSERLPENDERVLATTAWGEVTIAERIYPPIDDTCWFIHDGNTNATIDDVVAWMPLPEPYKGES